MFYPVERNIDAFPIRTETKTMKNKILNLSALTFAAALFGSAAYARPDFPVKRLTHGSAAKSDCCLVMADCKGKACCSSKMVAKDVPGGRASRSTFKKVRTCESNCTLAASEQRATCGKGM